MSDSESHPCPIIYEQFSRPDGSIDRCLYVSDSTGVGGSIRAFQKFLAMLGDAGSKFSHIRIMVSANAPRQASNGPCKSEAMTYLKNAMLKTRVRDRLRFPIGSDGSMAASVLEDLQKIKAVGAVPFLECPDMLKTAETRSSLAVAGIVPDEATLFTTKARKSFSEKMQEYEHALRWEKSASRPGVVVPDQRLFKCRGANMTKVAKHMAICFAHESREMMAGAAFVFTAIQASDFSTGLMILEDLVTNVLMPIYEMHRLVRVSISASKTLGSVQEQLVGYVLDLISRVSAQMKEMQSMDSNSDQKASLETCFESVKEIERDISGSVSVSVSVAEVEVAGESKVSGDVFVSSQVVQPVRVCMETEGPVPGGASSACL